MGSPDSGQFDSPQITYATKVWRKEFKDTVDRHPQANLIIGNNLGLKFIDIGETGDYYYLPELEAVKQTRTKYLLWYAGDVEPPAENWLATAKQLLKTYPIVTLRWWGDNIDPNQFKGLEPTEFGYQTQHFTDQCYFSTAKFMRSVDYDTDHPIAQDYPEHGGNSFERRVAQYLANQGLWIAVLKDPTYRHIDNRDKTL